ncbi:MAG TPA: cupin domain-containing protein [Rhizomicrobium sp.]|jgi:mannose-6-phosphate isomerase-like protein (cupin superfamily)
MQHAVIDMAKSFVTLRESALETVANRPGPPQRIDGYSIGIWETDRPAPHNGEMHPDGDELIVVLDGRIVVECDGEAAVTVDAGQAHIVPRGVWHRVIPQGRCRLLYATPGPNGEARHAG